MINLSELQSIAEQAARKAGDVLVGVRKHDAGILSAVGRDIKTKADQEAEAVILQELAVSGIPVLAEESGLHTAGSSGSVKDQLEGSEPLWIVDPLDGTYNYTRGMPWTCVSIALWQDGAPALGVIYDFNTDEIWTGIPGQGGTCNGSPISVSTTAERGQAVLCTGFPSARDMSNDALREMFEELQQFKKIRMIGSAALAMVFVARGWADAYHEESPWIWDIAAGVALIRAAGGDAHITNLQENGQLNIAASNGQLNEFF